MEERAFRQETAAPPEGRAAIERLYDDHAAVLLGYLRCLGAAETLAEDLLQEVFVKVAGKPALGKSVRNWRAYLLTMGRNEFYRWGTRIARRREIGIENIRGAFEPAQKGAPPEEAAAVEEALRALPAAQREVVVMKVYGGMTLREIARAMNTSLNTAASRYRYAIEKLEVALG